MSDEPSFPKEAVVGDPEAVPPASPGASIDRRDPAAGGQRKTLVKAGVAVGIGSAAIVAALLYANRGRRSDRDGK
jgi:hypothetical protein